MDTEVEMWDGDKIEIEIETERLKEEEENRKDIGMCAGVPPY